MTSHRLRFPPLGSAPDEDHVLVVCGQVAALGDALRQQAHRCLPLRLDAGDDHRERGLAAAHHTAGIDAARGGGPSRWASAVCTMASASSSGYSGSRLAFCQ